MRKSGYKLASMLALLTVVSSCGDNGEGIQVCGENGVGFVALREAAGLVLQPDVHIEIGTRYVAVDPSCRFAVYDASSEFAGVVLEGTLTSGQAGELSNFLALEEWELLDPVYFASLCDGPDNRFAWGERIVDVLAFCATGPFPDVPPGFRHDLGLLVPQLVERLRPLGEPAMGAVRYTLFFGEVIDESRFENAVHWPLEVPPESVAVNQGPESLGQVRTATGEDAQRLRALRSAVGIDEFRAFGGRIPIRQPDGARFILALRDVTEFENAEGRPSVSWTDLSQPPGTPRSP